MDVTSSTPSEEISIIDSPEAETPEDITPLPEEGELKAHQEEPITLLHALAGISSPQTLKIWGYIKHHKVVFLVDSGNTQNFIHK